jgi:TRAP transporter TAXI family solute receptor
MQAELRAPGNPPGVSSRGEGMMRLNAYQFTLLVLAATLTACTSGGPSPAPAGPDNQPEAGMAAPKAPGTIDIGTAGVTGVYYQVGSAVCRVADPALKQNGSSCEAVSTEGSIANIEGLRSGKLDMAIVQSDLEFEAYHGSGPFASAGAFPELRTVFALHPELFTVVARSDSGIRTFDDLKGKRVNIGNPGSGQRATMEQLMQVKGWTMKDFAYVSELDSRQQGDALAANQVDAIVFTVGYPSAAILGATKMVSARLIPVTGSEVDRLIAAKPYYSKAVIPGGFYPGNDTDTETFGVRATLVTSSAVPDEEVYEVVQSVFGNFDRFKRLNSALGELNKQDMVKASLSAPLHPGAERYYKQAGLM